MQRLLLGEHFALPMLSIV